MSYTTASGAIIQMRVDGADVSRREIESVATSMNRLSDTVQSTMRKLAATIGIGGGLAEIVELSDQYTKYTAQLRLATQSQREFAIAYADVRRIAHDAQADLAGTGTLYARIANGTRELGINQQRVAAITEVVNLGLKVSGATAAEAASAQLQLSQAFASGTLRGEEFNAVNEAAPRLMRALADGMGVPIGALKQMASDGKITSQVMANVLPQALASLRQEATQVQTIGGAFQVLKNNVMEFTAANAQSNGSVAVLSGGLSFLANNLTIVVGLLTTMTAAKTAIWLAGWATSALATSAANRTLAATTLATAEAEVAATASASALAAARVAELRAAVLAAEGETALAITTNGLIPAQARAIASAEAHTVALAAQATALRGVSVASGVARGALAFLGGPIGAIITVLGLAATAWTVWGNKAKDGSAQAAESYGEAHKRIVKGLDEQIAKNEKLIQLQNLGMSQKSIDRDGPVLEQLAAASRRLNDINNRTGEFAPGNGKSNDDVLFARLQTLKDIAEQTEKMQRRATSAAAADAGGTALTDLVAVRERLSGVNKQYLEDLSKLQTAREKGAIGEKEYISLVSQLATETYKSSEAGKAAAKASSAAASAAHSENSAYASLITSIGEKIAAGKLEAAGFDKLSDAQKLTIKLDEAIASGKSKLTPKHIAEARSLIEVVAAQDQANAAKKLAAERAVEMDKIQADYAEQAGKSLAAAQKEAEANEELVRTFGMTKQAIEQLAIARMEARIEQLRGIDMADDEIATLERLIEVKKRNSVALATRDGLEKQKAEWESIERTAHDTFIPIFDSGKSAFDRLRDTLKNGLLDLLYQMTIKKWIFNIGASVGMTGGSSTLAQAADLLGGGGGGVSSSNSAIGAAQSAATLYKAISGGFETMGTMVADTVQGAMYSSGMTSQIASNGSFATGAGVAAQYGAGMYAGHAIGNMIRGDYGSEGHGQAIVNTATVVGAIIAGPIGAAIGGALGGLWNRAFGMGSTEVKSQGMRGSISSNGLMGSNYQDKHQDGGWFRSDKNWTDTTAFSGEMASQFKQGFDAIKSASSGFASAIGASVDSIAGYSKSFDIKMTADAAANQKAITDFFQGVGDEMALRLVPNLIQFQKTGEAVSSTLERLAGDFQATNQVSMLLGTNGASMYGSLGVESAAARERLIDLAGGISNLTAQASTFSQNFLTEAERLAPVADAVAKGMASIGLASITSRDQFKQHAQYLIESGAVLTQAGAEEFASMMALADSFAKVHPLVEATTAALRTEADVLSERKDLQKQYDQLTMTSAELRARERLGIDASNLALFDSITQRQNVKATTDALQTMFDSLKSNRAGILSFADSLKLGSLSTLTPMQKYLETERQYSESLAKARTSPADSAAQSAAQTAATTFLTASQQINASSAAFVADRAQVLGDMSSLAEIAGAQMSDAQRQLALGGEQVTALATLNTTALGIQAAIVNLGAPGNTAAPAFDVQRYTAAANPGADVLVAEIKRLNARIDDLVKVTEGRRADAARQADDVADAIDNAGDAIAESARAGAADAQWRANNPSRREVR